jgi:hypothetical protein
MLEEIINYVKSLQNQIEFLSMKLSTTNPTKFFGGQLIIEPPDEVKQLLASRSADHRSLIELGIGLSNRSEVHGQIATMRSDRI